MSHPPAGPDPSPPGSDPAGDPFAPFVPRRGRIVAATMGVLTLVIFTVVAYALPGRETGGEWGPGDRAMFVAFAIVMAVVFWRYARIRATPSREVLVVRNILFTTTVPWRDIQRVEFGAGTPWVSIVVAGPEGEDTLAVMAIQRADGIRGSQEAGRLASLAEALGRR